MKTGLEFNENNFVKDLFIIVMIILQMISVRICGFFPYLFKLVSHKFYLLRINMDSCNFSGENHCEN